MFQMGLNIGGVQEALGRVWALCRGFTYSKQSPPSAVPAEPRLPCVEVTHIPVRGDGNFGPVAGRYSNSPVRYDSTDHGAPLNATGTNTHRSCASVQRSLKSTSSLSGSWRNSSIHCGKVLPAESIPPP